MTRHIRLHKGGRTARAPEARIRPATLERIHAEKRARKTTWANMIEEQWGDPLEQHHTGDEDMEHVHNFSKTGADKNNAESTVFYVCSCGARKTVVRPVNLEQAVRTYIEEPGKNRREYTSYRNA
jgi:hypothetical protein